MVAYQGNVLMQLQALSSYELSFRVFNFFNALFVPRGGQQEAPFPEPLHVPHGVAALPGHHELPTYAYPA